MQIYLYNSDDFDSLGAAIKERRIISAMAVFFEVWCHRARRGRQMSLQKGGGGKKSAFFTTKLGFVLKLISCSLIYSLFGS